MITKVYQCGFELNNLAAEGIFQLGNTSETTIQTASPYTGSYALRINVNDTAKGSAGIKFLPSLSQAQIGFFVRMPTLSGMPTPQARLFQIFGGTENILISLYTPISSNSLIFNVNGSQVGSTFSYTLNQYYHFGFDIKKAASGGWVNWYINGVLYASTQGDTGTESLYYMSFGDYPSIDSYGWADNQYVWVDDVFVNDTSGEAQAACPDASRFIFIPTNGNGNYSQMMGSDGNQVDNYALVDESVPNDDTDFVTAASSGLKDSYALGSFSLPAGYQINSVSPVVNAKKTSIKQIQLKVGNRLSSVDQQGSAKDLNLFYAPITDSFKEKPGGGAWTEADVNNNEILIESAGSYT